MGKKSFKELTTLKVGGKIANYFEVRNISELKNVISFAGERKLPIFVIGGGSDILVSDKDFEGVVIKYTGKKVSLVTKVNSAFITSESGLEWDELVSFSVKKNLQGIECLSGIPGTVGASPVQNIGAYGQELKDIFYSLKAFDILKRKFVVLTKKDCHFSYRESIFKEKENWQRFVIVEVTLKLKKNNKPDIKYDSLKKYLSDNNIQNPSLLEVRNTVLEIRKGKFENYKKVPNAGSFFKNPVLSKLEFSKLKKKYGEVPCFENSDGTYKCFAGWFIENTGWKGKSYKNAAVSLSHALILTNPDGKARANEILELAEKIIDSVYQKFEIKLEKEVQLINF